MDTFSVPHRFRSLLFVHQGGVGDFFLAWPLFAALSVKARGMPMEFAGPASRLPFLAPLGVTAAGRETLRALAQAHGQRPGDAGLLPGHPLDGVLVVHPGVRRAQAYPRGVTAVCPLMLGQEAGPVHAGERLLAQGLGALGFDGETTGPAWARGVFQERFGEKREGPGEVLLVPGAGHAAKRWQGAEARPVQFFLLARELARRGHACRFVLGPDEQEQGMSAAPWPELRPGSLTELCGALARSVLVVGGDTGALHLAGLLGRPVVALFGPTDERVWGPMGARVLRAPCPKGPCAALATDIDCPKPYCLSSLRPEDAAQAACELLEGKKDGSGF